MDQLTNTFGPFQLVSGGADGPDTWAEDYVRYRADYYPEPIIHEAVWRVNGKYIPYAGVERNTKIVKDADLVVAFWDRISNGTWDSIHKAVNKHKPVLVVYPNGGKELDPWLDTRRSRS